MATGWVLGKITDAIQPTVTNVVSQAGSYAGGAVQSVGAGISGVGSGIGGTIRKYGEGTKDYGNSIKNWANAPGPRSQTASNPLGLSDSKSAGKLQATAPSVYNPGTPYKPVTARSSSAPPAKPATKAATPATRAPASKPATKQVTPRPAAAKPATSKPAARPISSAGPSKPYPSTVTTQKKPVVPTSTPKPRTNAAPVPKGAATNPLGLPKGYQQTSGGY